MISFSARTTGLVGLDKELLREARKDARSALSKGSTVLASAMRNKLSRRRGPAAPGDPPARVTGALRDTVGKDRPRRREDVMSVDVGIGIGKAKAARVEHWKGLGINVHEYDRLQEYGGVFHGDGRRYPARSFARSAEAESESEVVSVMEEVLR